MTERFLVDPHSLPPPGPGVPVTSPEVPPYVISFLGMTEDGHEAWEVNGPEVAKKEIEFTDVATFKRFPKLIPPGQIWVATGALPDEINYYLYHQVREIRFMNEGMAWEEAWKAADKLELLERHRRELTAVDQDQRPERAENFAIQLLGRAGKIEVWEVDGPDFRRYIDVSYTQGSNWPARVYNPKFKIFVDSDTPEEQRPLVIFHELKERVKMLDEDKDYDTAHEETSAEEHRLLLEPWNLPGALEGLGYVGA